MGQPGDGGSGLHELASSYVSEVFAAERVPADWYPDPHVSGQLRYWDGSAWTDHTVVRDAVVEEKPAWRWLLYLAAVVLSIGAVTFVGLVLWRTPRYRSVGRTTFWLTGALPVVIVPVLLVLG